MKNRKIEKYVKRERIDKLIGIAEGKNIEMAIEAISGLATIKKDESFNFMVVGLRNSNKEIRLASIKGLGDLGMPRGRTHLSHIIDTDSDADIVEAAKEASLKLSSDE